MYYIKVKESHKWQTAQVSGRIFSKAGEIVNPAAVNDEILNSPLLTVAAIEPDPPEIDATDSARRLAEYYDIDLAGVVGTGEDGRIIKRDVETYTVDKEESS